MSNFREGVTVGEKIATSLIAKENNYSYYQLLLNVYAVAGQWEDVARIEQILKDRKIYRFPGCNLVDFTETVHTLKAGEDQWQEIVELEDAKVS
ncbi:pentatricopeptide repeat-containing protein [Corchorus capsularis]|uniref:Pentatricopeptide repeat-containing protein n=1 Tax=Corchorus capsularis TaxID=210143 RepID=A0A1R3GCG4_COCAP|nr:pentatricopeptide repeat-containing protein [Corchorus capsularis]